MKNMKEAKEDTREFLKVQEVPGSEELGMIKLDSEFAKVIGFTSSLFEGYLWRPEVVNEEDKFITISLITSKFEHQDNFFNLLQAIESMGYSIVVPIPSNRMEMICLKYGFKKVLLDDQDMGPIEALYYATTE